MNLDYFKKHEAAYKAGHCMVPHIPAGLSIEDKRRYLIGWLAELRERNYDAWAKATTIEIVKGGQVIAEFQCHKGQVAIL